MTARMGILYQGKPEETSAASVAAFLAAKGIDAKAAVVEYKGEILSAESAASAALEDGAELNVYRIVSGG